MKGQLYKGIEIGSDDPVNFVGVHPLVWHDHPEQPDLGFSEVYLPEKEEIWEETFKKWLSIEKPSQVNEAYVKGFEDGMDALKRWIEEK